MVEKWPPGRLREVKTAKFVATFGKTNLAKLGYFWPFGHFCPSLEVVRTVKNAVLATFFGHLATFENKSDHAKTQYSCGFAGFLATFPLFFLIFYRKKLKNIKEYRKYLAI